MSNKNSLESSIRFLMERTSVPSPQTKAVDVSSTNPSPQAGTNAPAYTSVTRSEGGGPGLPPGAPTPTAPPPESKMGWIERAYSGLGNVFARAMGVDVDQREAGMATSPEDLKKLRSMSKEKFIAQQQAALERAQRGIDIADRMYTGTKIAKDVLEIPASFTPVGAALNVGSNLLLTQTASAVGDKDLRNDAALSAALGAIPGGGAFKGGAKIVKGGVSTLAKVAGREGVETAAKEAGEALIKAGAKEGAETAAKSATSKVAKEFDRGPFLDDYLKQLEAKTSAQAQKNAQAKAAAELAAKTRSPAGTQAVARGIETVGKIGVPTAAAVAGSGLIPTQTDVSNVPQPQRQPSTQPSTQPQPQQAPKPSPQQATKSSTQGQIKAPGMRPTLSQQSSVGGSQQAGSGLNVSSDALKQRTVSFLKQGYEPMNNRKKFIEEQVRMILSEKIRREKSYGDEEPTEQPRRGRKMPESGEERETRERGEDRRPTERVAR